MPFARSPRRLAATLATVLALTAAAHAQEPAPAAAPAEPAAARAIDLQLNALTPLEAGCRLSFVARNGMGAELDELSLEIAVFRPQGDLARLIRLGFGTLLADKTRVRQFDVPDTPCDGIGRVIVNDVAACSGGSLDAMACLRALNVTSGTDVGFGL